ncbi:MAG: alpha/beta hydrolase, partial [Ilumatobacteraceae bacterium]
TAIDLRGHGASSHAAPYDMATMAGDVGTVLEVEGISDALLVGHSLGGAVVSAYAAGGSCRGVVNVDQPLALSGFQDALGQLRPMLQGDAASFRGAIGAMFDQMSGALVGSQRQRVDAIRSPDQGVVLGIWEMLFDSSAEELDATVDAMSGAITVPYLSVHGIDPGPGYPAWLTERIPTALVEVWPDLGHYPHLVEQQRFVDRVIEFDRSLT